MPNKYLNRKGIAIAKQVYKVRNWAEYNAALKRRGDIIPIERYFTANKSTYGA